MTKVAIITRTKDRPVFLKRAINSIYNQTFTDFEHAIINDGGDKASVEGVISELTDDQKTKLNVYHRDIPSNAPDTIFNESIDKTSAEYIVIHDDDDSWHVDFLNQTVAYLDTHSDIAGVVVRTDKIIEEVLVDGTIRSLKTTPWMPDLKVVNLYRQCIDNQMTPIAFLFRRSAYEGVGKFNDTLPVVGDWEFGIRLLQKYDIDYLDPGHTLAYYHHRKPAKTKVSHNSSFTNHDHRYYTNKVMNEYLRAELRDGRLGVGYIMSKLKYEQGSTARLVKSVLPKFVVRGLKKKIEN